MNAEVLEYLENVSIDKKEAVQKLFDIALKYLDKDFEATISYKTIGFVVPKRIYPAGYHCDTKLPLPFINIAAQKNFIAVYHMGIYANKALYDWFLQKYAETGLKLDIGKSCMRFKKPEQIPFELIGELFAKITVKGWIDLYEKAFK